MNPTTQRLIRILDRLSKLVIKGMAEGAYKGIVSPYEPNRALGEAMEVKRLLEINKEAGR